MTFKPNHIKNDNCTSSSTPNITNDVLYELISLAEENDRYKNSEIDLKKLHHKFEILFLEYII